MCDFQLGNDLDGTHDALSDFVEEDVDMQYALEQYFKQECIDGSDQMTFLEALKIENPISSPQRYLI